MPESQTLAIHYMPPLAEILENIKVPTLVMPFYTR